MIVRLIIRRLFFLIFVLLGLSLITFTLSHVVPSDPARMIAGPRASPAAVEKIRKEYGLDQPLWRQYVRYVSGLVRFDFGKSLTSRRPVAEDLKRYLPATIELALASMLFAVILGIPLGILSAVQRNSLLDLFGRTISILGLSIPSFWLALVLQFILFAQLGLLPDGQRLPIGVKEPPPVTGLFTIDALLAGNLPLFFLALKHLVMPSLVLGLAALAIVTRMVRSGMLEVLGQDYIRTARAKGLRPSTVILRHALKNALLPAVTVIGLQFGLLMGGAVLVEIIFSWPGIGRYAFQAIQNFDYNAVISVTLVIGAAYVLVNLLVDIAYVLLDPRIRVT
ncbi:ABC transporter permease [Thermomicrobium roseum]|uniref:Dipeptide transport system permease protein dppB n=1 Tax=Thermomicrobium roseum (strain ATCC 27502 / DSM 5159 / P-2) TaxID=309801 RepID=B9L1L9_THERP|nr:ABC transporter permease [Thermomicrobium roseum]ACM06232.1 dipeptide transport system permease protein dppB [Thermomicrobium roseum DSM 5159]